MKSAEGMEDREVSEDGRRRGRSEGVALGFCHAVAAEVMDRCGDLGTGLCWRQRVALIMAVERGVIAFQDSLGSRKRGIAEEDAMLFVCGGRPLRKVNGIGSAEKIGMLGSQETELSRIAASRASRRRFHP